WADGTITESEFLSGIEFLVANGIIGVPPTSVSSESSEGVPAWVKNNAGWWADGTITDSEFLNGIQYLIKTGLISVSASPQPPKVTSEAPKSTDSELAALEAQLEECSEIKKAYERLNCERSAKDKITAYNFKLISDAYQAGPVTFFWPGLGTEGNSFEITSSGQAMLRLRILVENTGSQTEALFCTGPAVCNYDVTNGVKDFKYSGMDFTNGQVVIKPGETKMFNMFFGPNIGGGGTTFEYDSEKDYYFRGSESFGSVSIPLNLG
ncbi:MAG: peptidase, partial [Nitrosopumilus sp.]|nr:peptidase [Nitrosopumilus sp.]